ncbi:hypothetical protein CAPTEDRAFT_213058 [Capitella teleta]|uniref:THAP-type domain-containing protein n=1 Tax=Capitella teleta TaxID=283909 RepID=R7VIK9_CAPTE|nr:hypothetical protein CAPTEDRAFT_213058 [Capitella teleta]|eukprot:ELU16126.1 hypothetical protein CAPTEDRAFT_213058 [Capitella teleta]
MSKSSGSFCAAAGCSEKKQVSRNRHFFRFPKDSNRCKRWVQNCRREDLMKASPLHLYKNCTMCDLHFTDSQFMKSQSKASLIREAVPTIFNSRRVSSIDITDPNIRRAPRDRSESLHSASKASTNSEPSRSTLIGDHTYHRCRPTSSATSASTPSSGVHLMSNVIVKLQSKVQSLSSSNSTATPTELTDQEIHASRPYFYTQETNIYAVHDVPHILKNIRNTLKAHDITYGNNQVASWRDVGALFKYDQNLPIRMAPKLTCKHIYLPPFTSMRIKQPLRGESSDAAKIRYFISQVETWRVKGKRARQPCFDALLQSLNAMQLLSKELIHEGPFSFLLTGRINQDCLENFFAQHHLIIYYIRCRLHYHFKFESRKLLQLKTKSRKMQVLNHE